MGYSFFFFFLLYLALVVGWDSNFFLYLLHDSGDCRAGLADNTEFDYLFFFFFLSLFFILIHSVGDIQLLSFLIELLVTFSYIYYLSLVPFLSFVGFPQDSSFFPQGIFFSTGVCESAFCLQTCAGQESYKGKGNLKNKFTYTTTYRIKLFMVVRALPPCLVSHV